MAKQASALLIVEKGAEDASVIPLDQERHVIGKFATADIALANPYVSRQHAQISLDQGEYKISDLGSKNGTYVNGVRLSSEARVLHSGDRIELGENQVVLRFQAWTSTLTHPPQAHRRDPRGLQWMRDPERCGWTAFSWGHASLAKSSMSWISCTAGRERYAARTRLRPTHGLSGPKATLATRRSSSVYAA